MKTKIKNSIFFSFVCFFLLSFFFSVAFTLHNKYILSIHVLKIHFFCLAFQFFVTFAVAIFAFLLSNTFNTFILLNNTNFSFFHVEFHNVAISLNNNSYFSLCVYVFFCFVSFRFSILHFRTICH